ncbi:MAG TPA: peptidylprolyl isomerase [Candidatus Dormibacteraeota bacterium]|nr:peptidylprolyl isomerase [Candidatus Dormibacteraeota bacterium]
MSKALRIVAGSVALLLGASLAACGGGSVVTVNGQSISRAQLDTKLEGSPIARSILQQMVQEALITQYAAQNHIAITDADIAAREDQLKANYPGDAWSQMLAARGLTEQDVHDALRIQLILDNALQRNITVTDAQIAQYFSHNHAAFDTPAQVCASHILVPDLATANKVEAALHAHGNFAALAQQYSIDPGSKAKGGSLGCFHRGQMVPAFDQAAFSLPIGQISQPVHSPFGYHIILVTSRQPAQRASLASARDRIKLALTQQQEAPLVQPFLESLQQKATITATDQRFAGLFPSPPPMPSVAPATAAPASPAPSPH